MRTTGTVDAGLRATSQRQYLRIQPSHGWRALDLLALWPYRDLIYILALRDVQVRYKQTLIGIAWAVLQPLAAMVIFTLILGNLIHVPSNGVPYPLFAYVGLLAWTYFASAAANSSDSLVANANLVSKVYFPRLVIPIAAMGSGLVDLGVGCVLLVGLMLWYGIAPGLAMLVLPFLVMFMIVTALGVGVWLSALDVQYRDVRYAIPFLIQIWMFATPVVYPASIVPGQYRPLLAFNPMVGVVEGFRWAVLGGGEPPGLLLWTSVTVSLLILVTGLFYFRRVERSFADLI